MKKILIGLLVVALILVGTLFFWEGGRNRVSEFFTENNDFGSFFDVDPKSENDIPVIPEPATSTPVVPGEYKAPVLRQLSVEPISGFTFFATTSTTTNVFIDPEQGEQKREYRATSTAVRFQERATGHVYDVYKFIETPLKVSNITVQKIYSALFTNDRNEFLALTPTFNNEEIKTTSMIIVPSKPETATASSTEQALTQTDISSAINNLLYIPSIDKIAYSLRNGSTTEIFTANTDRTEEKRVVTMPFNEFTIDGIDKTRTLVQTKASAYVPGYAYILSLDNGSLTKLIGNVSGLLVKTDPTLSYYIYSESTNSRPIVRAVDRNTGGTRQIGINTIPEKCVFSKKVKNTAYCFGSVAYASAVYPDDWYKGKIFNAEDLYRIDLTTGFVETVYVFEDNSFDVINPQLSTDEDMIAFQSKYDLTLWAIDLAALDNNLN